MAYIEKREKKNGKTSYRALVRMKGFPTESATFERKTDATKWAQQTEAAMREGRYFKTSEARRHTFGDLIDRYIVDVLPDKPKSQAQQSQQLMWWKGHLGDYNLSDITPALIAEYRDKLAKEKTHFGKGKSPATVARYLAALSHAFTIAVKEWGWFKRLANEQSEQTERT